MPYVVVRVYDESGPLVGAIREARDEVEAIMRAVPGFVRYGIIDTGAGAVSMTVCDDKAGTDASIKAAADWIKANLPDAKIAAPRILEGEMIDEVNHKRGEPGPHAILRIFSEPAADGIERTSVRDDMVEMMTSVPSFRAFTVFRGAVGGVSLVVADDKAGCDAVSDGIRNIILSKVPGAKARNPEVIEGTGVLRFDAADVPATA